MINEYLKQESQFTVLFIQLHFNREYTLSLMKCFMVTLVIVLEPFHLTQRFFFADA